jgi:hypothetical protein
MTILVEFLVRDSYPELDKFATVKDAILRFFSSEIQRPELLLENPLLDEDEKIN